jgi:hypothetical protein
MCLCEIMFILLCLFHNCRRLEVGAWMHCKQAFIARCQVLTACYWRFKSSRMLTHCLLVVADVSEKRKFLLRQGQAAHPCYTPAKHSSRVHLSIWRNVPEGLNVQACVDIIEWCQLKHRNLAVHTYIQINACWGFCFLVFVIGALLVLSEAVSPITLTL